MTEQEAPRTEAGRAFVALMYEAQTWWPDEYTRLAPSFVDEQVRRIEREAASAVPPTVTSADDWRVSTTHGRYVGTAPPEPPRPAGQSLDDLLRAWNLDPAHFMESLNGWGFVIGVAAPEVGADESALPLDVERLLSDAENLIRSYVPEGSKLRAEWLARLSEPGSPPRLAGRTLKMKDGQAWLGPTPPGEER